MSKTARVGAAALGAVFWCAYDRAHPATAPRVDSGPPRVFRQVIPDNSSTRAFSWLSRNMVLRKWNKLFLRTGPNIGVELLLVEKLDGNRPRGVTQQTHPYHIWRRRARTASINLV